MQRTIRLYQSGSLAVHSTVTLDQAASHHAATVLRMQPEELLTLFTGHDIEYEARILAIKKNAVQVYIMAAKSVSRESSIPVHLFQSPLKGDKMEWVVQKAVELGVVSIAPVMTARTTMRWDRLRFAKKKAQWEQIVMGACEQSGRNTLPKICDLLSWDAMLQSDFDGQTIFMDPHEGVALSHYTYAGKGVRLMIGPEGGFSAEETALMRERAYLPLQLGTRVLRAETAAVAGLSVIQACWGDFSKT